MSLTGIIGTLLVFLGAFNLRTYLQRKGWPVVEGSLDSVDVKIEATAPTEGVGLFVRPKYIQKIRYSYRGSPYIVEVSGYEIEAGSLKLRVNPEKPFEAFLDNKTLMFPILAISTGIILILLLIKFQSDGN
jgi:hypothetical protein